MSAYLRPILELTVLFPGAALCLLPVRTHLRYSPMHTALLTFLPCALLSFIGGALCALRGWETSRLLFAALPILGALYAHLTRIPPIKSISIYLAVCGAFSCLNVLSVAADSMFRLYNTEPWFSLKGCVVYNALCLLMLALMWRPFSFRLSELLEEETLAKSWRVFWVLPSIFITLNLLLVPQDYNNIRIGRMLEGYIMVELIYLSVLLLFYILFYFLARELRANSQLQRQNEFLQMQSAQYETLRTAIAETRHARHDLRHHVSALSSLAERSDWDALRGYLSQVRDAVPRAELSLCDNPAADAVAGHYAALCRREAITLECLLDLPRALPVAEMDLCVVLSNLMENALEASAALPCDARHIRAHARLHDGHLVLLTVENAYTGEIHENSGIFASNKHPGEGIGLQSVRRIAEKNGGFCEFVYDGQTFRANVMLR